jgi:hypothetical protein
MRSNLDPLLATHPRHLQDERLQDIGVSVNRSPDLPLALLAFGDFVGDMASE